MLVPLCYRLFELGLCILTEHGSRCFDYARGMLGPLLPIFSSIHVTYAVPNLESASICHKIISKYKYICLRMTSAIQAKVACV